MEIKKPISQMTKQEIFDLRISERLKSMNILDQIEFWYTSDFDFDLPERAEEKKIRMIWIWDKAKKGYPTTKLVNMFAKKFGCTTRRAHYQLNDAKKLFGDMEKTDIQVEKYLVTQMAKDTYRKAIKEGDIKGRNQSIANIIKALGLDKIDPNAIDWKKLQPSLYTIVLDDNARQIIDKLAAAPVTDLGALIGKFTEDAEEAEIDT